MSAEGGTGNWHSEVIFRGDSPTGKFTPWKNNPILTQRQLDAERPNPVTCAGHADLVPNPGRGLVGSLSGLPSHKQHVREFRT